MSVIRKYVLSEFRGQTTRDSIDNQIKNGVDFFPNTDAPGFTPKTDLESLYNKVKDGNLGPVGGNVSKYANLLPGQQSSQFSFPNADRENNININPEGFLGLKTTFDLPRESFRFTTLGPENDTFKPTFSSTLGLGSSKFTDTIDLFHRYESSEFTNLPGISSDNLFFNRSLGEGGSFRKAADPVGLTHPIILRPFGSNWKNAYTDLQIANLKIPQVELKFGQTLATEGVSLADMASRNIADYARILRWSLTPQGASFITKQHSLQRMNPTIETKKFNPDSILGVAGGLDKTVLPIYHPERHVGGLASRYENVLHLTGLNPEPGLQLTGGSRLAYQAAAFTIDIPPVSRIRGDSFLTSLANLAIGAFNGIVDQAAATISIGLSNPNKYAPFQSAAPISTHLGYVSFGIPTAQVAVDTLLAQFKPGGTFNKNTAKSTKTGIKRHHTLDYSRLDKALSYEDGGRTGGEWDKKVEGVMQEKLQKKFDGMEVNEMVGKQGLISDALPEKSDELLGIIKGDNKSPNVDKINIMPIVGKGDERIVDNKDFIKFRFRDMINERYIVFRAILDGISDSITPEYGEERYIGRPDKVYVYQGADRNISFNFSIYPKTKQELPLLVEKMEYLVGLCYPSYTQQNFMKTPFITLTMGDMFNEAPGILTGLTITVEDTSTWEIDDGLQFPHFIRAACEFKYIGKSELRTDSRSHYALPKKYRQFLTPSTNFRTDEGTVVLDDAPGTGA